MSKIIPCINGSKKIIIVSFAGHGLGLGTLPQFEFVNFLTKHFPETEKHFYLDKHSVWYHKGIENISSSIDETVKYLSKIIKDYNQSIFIGSSSGAYASILFGSILNVSKVIAFKPQTIVPKQGNEYDKKYMNLKNIINKKTKYYIFGDISVKETDPYHHISHCYNINNSANVILNKDYNVDLKKMRDDGSLLKIFNSIIKN